MSNTRVFLDYAASTPVDPVVRDAMRAYEDAHFANAFSVHTDGREAKRALEDARFAIAAHLGARSSECFFAPGATEAMTRVVYGVINGLLEQGKTYADMHIVMSAIEHSTVRTCVEGFARRGAKLSVVGVTPDGCIDLAQMKNALRDETVLVLCMLVNNEIGTIQPVRDIARMLSERSTKPLLAVDASQAPLCMKVVPSDFGADFCVFDAGKIYGPKKTALLYVRNGIPFQSLCGVAGKSGNEGTPDVASAIGMRVAYDVVEQHRDEDVARWTELKSYFVQALTERFPTMRINGEPSVSISNILNVSFPNVEGEFLASQCDTHGVAISAKSACLSGGGEGSYVVAAIDPERANNSVRFSFGRETSKEDIDYTVSVLADIVTPRM